jgi:hypothetical protein
MTSRRRLGRLTPQHIAESTRKHRLSRCHHVDQFPQQLDLPVLDHEVAEKLLMDGVAGNFGLRRQVIFIQRLVRCLDVDRNVLKHGARIDLAVEETKKTNDIL